MIIQIRGTYTEGPYCDIIADGKITHAYGFDKIKELINDARARGEAVEFKGRNALEDAVKLNKLLEKK